MSSALQLIKSAYESDENSDEEFPEQDNNTAPVESHVPPDDQTDEKDFHGFDEREVNNSVPPESDYPDKECSRISIEDDVVQDSDGSFFDDPTDPVTGNRKRPKKEQQRLLKAKKRRLSHGVKFESCGCHKECSNVFSKDERMQENCKYWNYTTGKAAFVRERVQRVAIQRRRTNRHTGGKFKMFRYLFHAMTSNGEIKGVCRKFFLNTIGYNETCGYIFHQSILVSKKNCYSNN